MTKTAHPQIQVENVSIDQLRPDPVNPRRIGEAELEALARSIRQYGMVQPVIARREDGTVIGGHQRLVAARKLGLKTVPVVYVDLSVEQGRVLNLALNKISGSWDEELLAHLLADLNATPNVDLSLSGFKDDEIKNLLRKLDAREKRDRPEAFDLDAALDEATREPRMKRGDVWHLGPHRLACGDATDSGDIARLMAGHTAVMTFTDPPYNVNLGDHGGAPRSGRKRKVANDNLGPAFEAFLERAMGNILEATEGGVYVCMSSSELHTLQRTFVAAGGHWSTFIIWAKSTFTVGRSDYQRQYEPILYGWRDGAKHHWCGARDQGDVWTVDKPGSNPLHPTMKPLALMERAIANSSQPDDVVLDPFLGSGSTLIACERKGRSSYGMELDPRYCDVAMARWEAFTGEQAKKEPAK